MTLDGLSGKVAVVTGAGRGIGRAVLIGLRAAGCQVVACDINSSALADFQQDPDIFPLSADIATAEGADQCAKAALEAFGCIDFLVNCAAILTAIAPIADLDLDEFDRVIAVNLRGTMLIMRACLGPMIKRGNGGAIVCLASRAAFRPSASRSAYNVSKAAVVSLVETAALENGRYNIRVNSVAPGVVDTPILLDAGPGFEGLKAALKNWPITRMAKPDEVANIIIWLLSDQAVFVTGATYKIDGGSTI